MMGTSADSTVVKDEDYFRKTNFNFWVLDFKRHLNLESKLDSNIFRWATSIILRVFEFFLSLCRED